MIYYVIFWIAITVLAIIIEFETASLVSIWFALGAFIAAILAVFSVHFAIQLSVFIVVSMTWFFIIKKYFPQLGKSNGQEGNPLIGKEVLVIETVDEETHGSGNVDGSTWTLVVNPGEKIEKNKKAIVVEIQGNKLLVTLKK